MEASIKASYLWKKHLTEFHLRKNVRVQLSGDPEAETWANVLLQIGEGKLAPKTGIIKPPEPVHIKCKNKNDLIDEIFPDVGINFERDGWLSSRAILAPKNDVVDDINELIMQKIPGVAEVYYSTDCPIKGPDSIQYPTEVLNSLSFPGIPAHRIILKKGVPVIVMRNINAPMLVNGTRLQITELGRSKLTGKILVGAYAGQEVYIPRIAFIPKDCAIEFKRIQFPVKVSFSMSINKSQGQTLKKVGLWLEEPCFAHGQFYVGCSRVGSDKNLKIACPDQGTRNVVYKEALGQLM